MRRTFEGLRRRLLLGVGVLLFVAGAITLAVGLIGYFDKGTVAQPETTLGIEDLIPEPPDGIEDVEGLPVAIPYYNPYPRVTTPLRLVVEKLDVDAPIVEMGLDGEGVPQVPLNGQDVAWYNFSAKPGAGSNAVFAGHINWSGSNGVFGNLDELENGDRVLIVADEGQEYAYEVFANFRVDPADPASLKVMAPTADDTVTLITCGGTWIPDPAERFGGNYTDRTIVQARRVSSSVAAPAPAGGG